jgi:hypothetical protein
MNRSILIVICDFLLLSLLTFSTDINHMADENTRPPTKVVVSTNSIINAGDDLAAAMKLALQEEQKNTAQLQQQLATARESTSQQQTQLSRREEENVRLQQQFATAQTNLENLNRQLQTSAAQSAQAQQKLAAATAEVQRESAVEDALRRQLNDLSRSNLLTQSEKQQLASQLQLAEVEKRAANEKAGLLQQQAQTAQAENTRLTESFQTLATNSSRLTQEIRANTPLAPNALFSDFVSNRITAAISAERTGLFGSDVIKNKNAETILVTDGTTIFALCHVQDTPLTLWDPGTDWDKFTGTLSHGATQVPIHSMAFHEQDPRVVLLPVSQGDANKLGCKIYRLSSDPYKFQDAVLVGADEGYYGECSFQIQLQSPQYVKLDRNLLKGLFGKFNPSRGDLVFSRAGELLGIMVNNTYCLTLHGSTATTTFSFDQNLRSRHTGDTLSELYGYVFQMPPRLQ